MATKVYDPPNGEDLLSVLPKYGGAGGSLEAAKYYAGQDFVKQFGRNPTQSELNLIAPAYVSGDPNLTNSGQGQAAISQYYQSLSNTPDQINKSNQDKYLKDAPQHYDAVNGVFQSQLGRAATQDELDHFGSAVASGGLDQYSLKQFVQQQPEYQTNQNTKFQTDLSGKLASYDQDYFNKNILPSIQSTYAKQGRSFDSSAFTAATANAAENQTADRGKYIAGITAQQYGGVEDRAYQDYANAVANSTALTNAGITAKYGGIQGTQNRVNQIQDFNTQQNLYNQYLAKYGKRSNGVGGLIGTAIGAGVGGYFGGTAGAGLGANLGGTAGSAIQNSGGSY